MKIVSKIISNLQLLYKKYPKLYPFVEVSIVLSAYFLSVFIFWLWYWGVYFTTTLTVIAALVFISSFIVHKDRLKDLGIRFDNILISMKECIVAAIIFLTPVLILFIIYFDYYVPHEPSSLLKYFLKLFADSLKILILL